MPLVFAAIVPHPPLLVPTANKEGFEKLSQTKQALEKLEEDLYLAKPDVLVVFSPHGNLIPDAFTVNVSAEFENDFKEFGNVTTKVRFKGEISLAAAMREQGTAQAFPIILISEPIIDHGVSIPLLYLTAHLPEVAILPIGFSALGTKTHVDFGYFLKEHFMRSTKRIAVIASADLSHSLTPEAPGGFHPEGKDFDHHIQEFLKTNNVEALLNIDPNEIEKSAECGFRAILLLFGVLQNINFTYLQYCYEAPFGVGYLTANLSF